MCDPILIESIWTISVKFHSFCFHIILRERPFLTKIIVYSSWELRKPMSVSREAAQQVGSESWAQVVRSGHRYFKSSCWPWASFFLWRFQSFVLGLWLTMIRIEFSLRSHGLLFIFKVFSIVWDYNIITLLPSFLSTSKLSHVTLYLLFQLHRCFCNHCCCCICP